MGWYVHGMVGFDADRAFEELSVPKGYTVQAVYTVGRMADPAGLPEDCVRATCLATGGPWEN